MGNVKKIERPPAPAVFDEFGLTPLEGKVWKEIEKRLKNRGGRVLATVGTGPRKIQNLLRGQ
jgi:hypothetical protein